MARTSSRSGGATAPVPLTATAMAAGVGSSSAARGWAFMSGLPPTHAGAHEARNAYGRLREHSLHARRPSFNEKRAAGKELGELDARFHDPGAEDGDGHARQLRGG